MKRAVPMLRWAAGGVLVAGLLSRFLGLLREMLIANAFGVSSELDAAYLGLSLPLALIVGTGGGLSRAVVPVAASMQKSRFAGFYLAGARRLVQVMAPVSILLAVTAWGWSRLLVLGESSLPHGTLLVAAILGSLAMIGGTVAGFFTGLANARGHHVSASSTPLLYNAVVCASVYFLTPRLGILSLLAGIFLAEWLQLVWLWPVVSFITRGVRPRLRRTDLSDAKRLFWPASALGMATGFNLMIDRMFATMTDAGSVAALTYADKLVTLPAGLLGAALAAPLFTRMSRFRDAGEREGFRRTLLVGIRLLIVAGTPTAILITAASEPIIGILLERGAFTGRGVELASLAMTGYAPGVPFRAMTILLLGAGLAARRPWSLVVTMLGITALNAVLDYYFVQFAGLLGIALATSLVGFVRALVMILIIDAVLVFDRGLWTSLARTIVYAIGLSVPLWLLRGLPWMMEAGTMMGRLAEIGAVTLVASVATAVMWKPLIEPEWRSLRRLRNEVARHARSLGRAEAGV